MNLQPQQTENSQISAVDRVEQLKKPFKKTELGKNYTPGPHDVIIGRGKKCYNHIGNKELRRIVGGKLDKYSASANNKLEKSVILSSIVNEVRMKGGFVKEEIETGVWFDVGDTLGREKVAQTFRDALHENYRSSIAFKSKKRRELTKSKVSVGEKQYKRARIENTTQTLESMNFHARIENTMQDLESMNYQDCQSSKSELSGLVSMLSSSIPSCVYDDENPFEPLPIAPTEAAFQPEPDCSGSFMSDFDDYYKLNVPFDFSSLGPQKCEFPDSAPSSSSRGLDAPSSIQAAARTA